MGLLAALAAFLVTLLAGTPALAEAPGEAPSPLPRRAWLGVRLGPAEDDRPRVDEVFPGGTAVAPVGVDTRLRSIRLRPDGARKDRLAA